METGKIENLNDGKPCDTDPVNMRPLASINHNLERIADHLDELFGSPAHKKMERFEKNNHPEDVAPPRVGSLSALVENLNKNPSLMTISNTSRADKDFVKDAFDKKDKGTPPLFERVDDIDKEGGALDMLRDQIANKASEDSVNALRMRVEAIEAKVRS